MSNQVVSIPVSKIDADWNWNSRKNITVESVASLAQSIEDHGLDVPVTVRPVGDRFSLVSGFRRFKAVTEVLKHEQIDCFVRVLDDFQAKIANFRENGDREQLTFWEECLYIRETFPPEYQTKMIQEELNKPYDWVRPRRQIWDLPQPIIDLAEQGVYGWRDILELLKRNKAQQHAAAKAAVAAARRGENKKGIRKSTAARRTVQGRKNMGAMMNIIDEHGLISDKKFQHVMAWASGDLSVAELAERLSVDPELFLRIDE